MQGVVLVCQALVLCMLEEESSLCLPVRRAEWGFLLNLLASPSRQTLLVKKEYTMSGLKTASKSSWYLSQYNSTSSRSAEETWYQLVSISCAPMLESTSSLISCVTCWLEVTGSGARWLFKKCCLCDNNKLQAAGGISWELIAISWTNPFTVRLTESGPSSRDHSISSLDAEKFLLF